MKLYKPYTRKQYADLASFCNNNGMIILDSGDYLESVLPPIHIPTNEEQRVARANAYLNEIDPITAHISRLKDYEQTAEIIAEIEALKAERSAKVQEIRERYPYMEN